MAASIFNNATNGLIKIRDALKTAFAPAVGITDDGAAFAIAQTRLNPTAGSTSVLVKNGAITNVNDTTFDVAITVTGATEFTNKNVFAVGPCLTAGTDAAAAQSAQGRVVRALPIGVEATDVHTIGLRISSQDNS